MVAAITIGIGVDDTLHLLVQYNRELKSLKDEKKALEKALRTVILPIIVTSIGLAAGFFVLSFSSFLPVQQFGMLSAIVIVIAVFADMILTPALFSTKRLITLWDLLGIKLQNTLHDKCRLFQGMSMWQVKNLSCSHTWRSIQREPSSCVKGNLPKSCRSLLKARWKYLS